MIGVHRPSFVLQVVSLVPAYQLPHSRVLKGYPKLAVSQSSRSYTVDVNTTGDQLPEPELVQGFLMVRRWLNG